MASSYCTQGVIFVPCAARSVLQVGRHRLLGCGTWNIQAVVEFLERPNPPNCPYGHGRLVWRGTTAIQRNSGYNFEFRMIDQKCGYHISVAPGSTKRVHGSQPGSPDASPSQRHPKHEQRETSPSPHQSPEDRRTLPGPPPMAALRSAARWAMATHSHTFRCYILK